MCSSLGQNASDVLAALWHFCNFIRFTTEILLKYAPGNVKEATRLQCTVDDYVSFLQAKISNGEVTVGAAHNVIGPIKLFC